MGVGSRYHPRSSIPTAPACPILTHHPIAQHQGLLFGLGRVAGPSLAVKLGPKTGWQEDTSLHSHLCYCYLLFQEVTFASHPGHRTGPESLMYWSGPVCSVQALTWPTWLRISERLKGDRSPSRTHSPTPPDLPQALSNPRSGPNQQSLRTGVSMMEEGGECWALAHRLVAL